MSAYQVCTQNKISTVDRAVERKTDSFETGVRTTDSKQDRSDIHGLDLPIWIDHAPSRQQYISTKNDGIIASSLPWGRRLALVMAVALTAGDPTTFSCHGTTVPKSLRFCTAPSGSIKNIGS